MQKYQQRYGPDATSKPSKNAAQHLAEEVMAVRLREAESVAELKETKQRAMELETQVGLCNFSLCVLGRYPGMPFSTCSLPSL